MSSGTSGAVVIVIRLVVVVATPWIPARREGGH
jgi:hypothetical protein